MPEPATLNAEAVAELLRQLAFLSAVLGGFAATFLATLLALGGRHRVVDWAVGAAAFAAVGFLLTAIVSALSGIDALTTTQAVLERRRWLSTTLFWSGLFPLLFAIGLCGWVRSRAVGVATTVAAGLGALLVLLILLEA
jgi:hypothetical protein